MSVIYLLVSDYPLPEVDMRMFKETIVGKTLIGFEQGFAVEHRSFPCYNELIQSLVL